MLFLYKIYWAFSTPYDSRSHQTLSIKAVLASYKYLLNLFLKLGLCLFYHFIIIFLTFIDFYPIWYEDKKVIITLMINSTYLYSFFILFATFSIFYLFHFFRPGKNEENNKILLKNLLEGLDMELPEELKTLDNSSTDPQKL